VLLLERRELVVELLELDEVPQAFDQADLGRWVGIGRICSMPATYPAKPR
jgi:hypothetical protein